IASDTHREFGRALNVVEAAELLELVDTPKRLVVLEPLGQRFVRARAEEQQAIWREQLLKLRLFREMYDALQRQPDHAIYRDFPLETIAIHMPQENSEKVFQTFIGWARFGNLFAYDEINERISLQ